MTPITVLGKFLGAITALLGVSTVALMTGIVANAFARQMDKRRVIFEAEVSEALRDGVIDSEEQEKVDRLKERLNISDEEALAIIELLSDGTRPFGRSTVLTCSRQGR